MAKILIEESLIEDAAIAIEHSAVYLTALRLIAKKEVLTAEGKELSAIAADALKAAEDKGILSSMEYAPETP